MVTQAPLLELKKLVEVNFHSPAACKTDNILPSCQESTGPKLITRNTVFHSNSVYMGQEELGNVQDVNAIYVAEGQPEWNEATERR